MSQLEGLVLSVDENTNTAFCYSEGIEAAITVKLPTEFNVKRGQSIVLADFECSGNVFTPSSQQITVKDSEKASFHGNELTIKAVAACSDNETHKTYPMSLAYAGAFSYVNVAGISMVRGTAFYVLLAVNDLDAEANGVPLFKIYERGAELSPELRDPFICGMLESEERQECWEEWNQVELREMWNRESKTKSETVETATTLNPPPGIVVKPAEQAIANPSVRQMTEGPPNSNFTEYQPVQQIMRASPIQQLKENQPPSKIKDDRTTNRNIQMNLNQKKELELHVFVLKVNEQTCIAYDTSQLELLTINIVNHKNKVVVWKKLRFISGGRGADGVIQIQEGSSVTVSDSADVIGDIISNTGPELETFVIFSSNVKYASFHQKRAVSESYGYILMPPTSIRYDAMTVYRVTIKINQINDPTQPFFKAVSELEHQKHFNAAESFIEIMKKFEENFFKTYNENGYGVNTIPDVDVVRNNRPQADKLKHVELNFVKFNIVFNTDFGTYVNGLVLEIDGTKRVSGKVWTKFGNARIEGVTTIETTGMVAKPGDWVQVRLENRHRKLCVKKLYDIAPIELQCRIGENYLYLEGQLSANNPVAIGGLLYYQNAILGPIEVDRGICQKQQFTENVLLKYSFHDINLESKFHSYWALQRIIQPSQLSPFTKELNQGYYSQKTVLPAHKDHLKGQSDRQYNGDDGPHCSADYSNQDHLHSRPVDYSNNTRVEPQQPIYQQPSPMSQSSISVRSEPRNRPQKMFERSAQIAAVTDRWYIAYLGEVQRAAFVSKTVPGPTVKLGSLFSCYIVPLEVGADAFYEIVEVCDILDARNEVRVHEEKESCTNLFHVDLCYEEKNFRGWTQIGGCPILKSEEIGYYTVAPHVTIPSGDVVQDKSLVKMYIGQPKARDMVGWFRFVKRTVPERMFDNNPSKQKQDDPVYTTYVWELEEVSGNYAHFDERRNQCIAKNLGKDREKFEEEDDIARQKRINKEGDMSRANSAAASPYGQSRASSVVSYQTTQDHFGNNAPSYRGQSQQSYYSARDGYGSQPDPYAQSSSSGYQNKNNAYNSNESNFGAHSQSPASSYNRSYGGPPDQRVDAATLTGRNDEMAEKNREIRALQSDKLECIKLLADQQREMYKFITDPRMGPEIQATFPQLFDFLKRANHDSKRLTDQHLN
ncbi:unnamed protein product [Caenorhabditis sp. 36 PRJEB53466]|nr:unnamed protein product [Caenorhabditis sp. 36 PRJEB53466]